MASLEPARAPLDEIVADVSHITSSSAFGSLEIFKGPAADFPS